MHCVLCNVMVIGGFCHYAMCIGVCWFNGLCVHYVVYFDFIVVIDGQIMIVDFVINCNL